MVKKCIISNDEKGNPIGLVELKEFTDIKSFKDFKELCEKNRKLFEERKAQEKARQDEKEIVLNKRIEILEEKCEMAIRGIAYLLGVEEAKGIEEAFEAYFRAARGEINNEEEH